MISRRILFWSLAFATLISGCASDIANRYYAGQRFPPRPTSEVQIYWKNPDRPFTVLADLQSRGESPEDMRKKGAEMGADAVIVSLLGGNYSLKEQWAGQDRYSQTYTRIAATVIKFD
jgi:hypothetical protein